MPRSPSPLGGLRVAVAGAAPALRAAGDLLGRLGATATEPPSGCVARRVAQRGVDLVLGGPDGGSSRAAPGARLTVPSGPLPTGGVPAGTVDLAAGMVTAGAAIAGWRSGSVIDVDPLAVATLVYLPLAFGRPGSMPAPRPVGGGAVCADLDADGDADAFTRLLDVAGADAEDPERLAERAQEWRLPVTPYRRMEDGDDAPLPPVTFPTHGDGGGGVRPSAPTAAPVATGPRAGTRDGPLAGVVVVDLTVMWAGPLCTWLLAALGAEVVKVEPSCRLDGLRLDTDPDTGTAPMFEALNRGKRRADLDLRRSEQRAAFFDLVARADLVIDNFSPRVPANLGIGPGELRAHNPAVATLSMPAFPAGRPERAWVAYGTGVHAASGLGDCGAEGFRAPAVTYPDPVAGFTAFAVALALLAGRDRGRPAARVEVPLRSAVEPLRAGHCADALRRPPAGVRRLADLPPPPFAGPGVPVPLDPAPPLGEDEGPHPRC